MAVPRQLILSRLNQNIDNLVQVGERFVRGLFLSEIYSPFQSTCSFRDFLYLSN